MDWSTLPSDFVAGVLGTMIGLVVGLRIDRKREHRRSRLREERLIQNLINHLATRRAFSHAPDVGLVDSAEDMERCNLSVLDVRRRIGDVREQIGTLDGAFSMLEQMESDCVSYLNHVDQHPMRYAIAASRLGDRLHGAAQELRHVVPALEVTRPGSRSACATADWLA